MNNTILTLDDRIRQDLTELFDEKPISGAQSLSGLIEVSTKWLPQHFVGNRDAKTVLVMLNPGEDWAAADKHFCCSACGYDHSSRKKFVACYIDEKTTFGETDKDREQTK